MKNQKSKARYPIATTGGQELYERVERLRSQGVLLTDIINNGCKYIEALRKRKELT